MQSILTQNQKKTFGPVFFQEGTQSYRITAHVRYDDACGNGHNTFTITGEVKKGDRGPICYCGRIHDDVAAHFPQLAPFIKWHLCSSNQPLHYVENSMYWAGKRGWCNGGPNDPPNLARFRATAIWPYATADDMESVTSEILQSRLGELLAEFKAAVQSLGFVF